MRPSCSGYFSEGETTRPLAGLVLAQMMSMLDYAQQVMALTLQLGGIARPDLDTWLGTVGSEVSEADRIAVLRHMLSIGVLAEDSGVLGLGETLFFRHRRDPAANPGAAPILGQEKPGDVEKPEFRSAVEPADELAGLGFADKHREWAKVVVSSLAHIIGAEAIADYRCVGGSKLIGHGDVHICLGIVTQHIRLL